MNALAAAAVVYAHRGWAVFPLAPRGKRPITRHGLKDATCDPGLVGAWWTEQPNANIGVSCGASDLLVVDLDGAEAVTAWSRLTSEYGGHARTLTAMTAKGAHLYFAGEGRSSAGKLAPGIDTRGAGGYVVAPPSVHESGAVYAWADPEAAIVPLPGWVKAMLAPRSPSPVGEARQLPAGAPYTRYGLTALAHLVDEMAATAEGQRNHTLNALAYRAGRLSAGGQLAEHVAEHELIRAAIEAGLPEQEAVQTFWSGFHAGCARPVEIEERSRR